MLRENNFENNIYHRNIKVLMYHKIVPDNEYIPSQWTNVSAGQFRKHLMLLDKWGFTPITFKDYLLFCNGNLNLPKKPVVLTFDDGYEEIYKLAFPIIKDMGWNAVVFVVGDSRIKIDVWNKDLSFGNPNLLSREQILEMNEAGFEIGSHSMSHQYLTDESYSSAWYEISRSKEELELLLQTNISSFSYPYGAVNKHIKRLVRKAGYELACGVYTGPPKFGNDIFDIRRITIPAGTETLGFAVKILLPFEYYEYIGSKIMHPGRHNETKVQINSGWLTKSLLKSDEQSINI